MLEELGGTKEIRSGGNGGTGEMLKKFPCGDEPDAPVQVAEEVLALLVSTGCMVRRELLAILQELQRKVGGIL